MYRAINRSACALQNSDHMEGVLIMLDKADFPGPVGYDNGVTYLVPKRICHLGPDHRTFI